MGISSPESRHAAKAYERRRELWGTSFASKHEAMKACLPYGKPFSVVYTDNYIDRGYGWFSRPRRLRIRSL